MFSIDLPIVGRCKLLFKSNQERERSRYQLCTLTTTVTAKIIRAKQAPIARRAIPSAA